MIYTGMKTNSAVSQVQNTTASTSVVRHRRHSGLPLKVPVAGEQGDTDSSQLQQLEERFKDASPHEREILRKLGFMIQQELKKRRKEGVLPPLPSGPV